MASLPLILAAATEHAAEEGLLGRFAVEGPFLVSQIISFSVVAFILYKFAFKPVLATIEERQGKIDSGLKYAEEMKVKLAEAEAEKKKILQEASIEAKDLVAEARQTAEVRIEKSAQEAIKAAEDITKKAELQIENDRKQMLAEARSEISRLVVATASKVLSKELTAEEKARYSESASSTLV